MQVFDGIEFATKNFLVSLIFKLQYVKENTTNFLALGKYTHRFFSIDLDPTDWERMKQENGWNSVQLRDNRYNQIIHMVSAANGAEPFYTIDGHNTRHEGLDTARKLDEITAAVCTCSALCLCIQDFSLS